MQAKYPLVIIALILILMATAPVYAADLYASLNGTITRFDVSIEDPGNQEITFNYPNITDFTAIGPDQTFGGTQYKIMNMDSFLGTAYRIVVRACNNQWCTSSAPLLTGLPEILEGSIRIE